MRDRVRPLSLALLSLLSLGLFATATVAAMRAFDNWLSLIGAAVLWGGALLLHKKGGRSRWFYLGSFALSSAASGLSAAAYYLERLLPLTARTAFLAVLPAAAVLVLLALLVWLWPKINRFATPAACIMMAVLAAVAVILRIRSKELLYGFAGFGLLIGIFCACAFGISVNHPERSLRRDLSYAGFGAFFLLTLVVIVLLTEGDIFEGLSFDPRGKRKIAVK